MKEEKALTEKELKDLLYEKGKEGKVIIGGMERRMMVIDLDEFISQPIEGILYDLNKLPEVIMSIPKNPNIIDDYATYLVIKRLKETITNLTRKKKDKCGYDTC